MKETDFRPRTLEEVCDEVDFHLDLVGNTYCSLRMGNKIRCSRQSTQIDQNGLYPCLHPKYNNNDYIKV